jgi:hypothetical protein
MSQSRSPLRHLRRRPSAAMGVAVVALFLAIGGVGYAATSIPNNSISNAMLKNNSVSNTKLRNNSVGNIKLRANSVSYQKIAPGSVGTARIDQKEVQESINGTCNSGTAITAIAEKGTVTCAPTLPAESDSGVGASTSLTSSTVPATVATYGLAAGSSYLVQSDPYVTVVGDGTNLAQSVTVSCTLAAGTGAASTQTRSATLNVTAAESSAGTALYASIPLTVTEPSSTASTVAAVTCTQTPSTGATPAVHAQSTVYALQTASNTSAAG